MTCLIVKYWYFTIISEDNSKHKRNSISSWKFGQKIFVLPIFVLFEEKKKSKNKNIFFSKNFLIFFLLFQNPLPFIYWEKLLFITFIFSKQRQIIFKRKMKSQKILTALASFMNSSLPKFNFSKLHKNLREKRRKNKEKSWITLF